MLLLDKAILEAFPDCRDAVFVSMRDAAAKIHEEKFSRINGDEGFRVHVSRIHDVVVSRASDPGGKFIRFKIPKELLDQSVLKPAPTVRTPNLKKWVLTKFIYPVHSNDTHWLVYFPEESTWHEDVTPFLEMLAIVTGKAEASIVIDADAPATGDAHHPIVVDDE
jgi:hypothetical protein